MRQFTNEQIQDRFEELTPELQEAIASPEVHETIEKVAAKHDLRVDQLGELVDEIGLVMLGLLPSKDFVKTFSREAQMSEADAKLVADDINAEIFSKIRSSMQSLERDSADTPDDSVNAHIPTEISSVEKAGGFTIEQEDGPLPPPNLPVAPDSTEVTPHDKEAILAGIEDPLPAEAHVEPLVDMLLSGSQGASAQNVSKTATDSSPRVEKTPQPPRSSLPQAPQRSGPDPYREAI